MYHTTASASARAAPPAAAPTVEVRTSREGLDAAIRAARRDVLSLQHADGYWCHELEADCTIPAEYILMLHFLGESEPALEAKMARYLRRRQGRDGGWPLYEGGEADVSCSVKAYFALKLAGDTAEAPHMKRARAAILALGGAARANVFTRITLALFGELPWRGVPCVPIELILLPRWFWFHIDKVSYWSRTVMTPLALLCSLKARAANPLDIHIAELFTTPPHLEKHYFAAPRSRLGRALLLIDRIGHRIDPRLFARLRRRAIARAESWILERLNGSGGLGAIFPAMVNACEALAVLGYPPEHRLRRDARRALRELVVVNRAEAYCQPCTSPVWDTALTCLALQEDLGDAPAPAIDKALSWLRERQLLQAAGDWCRAHPGLAGGGWAFQFRNDAYPDLDDTAAVALAMRQADAGTRYEESLRRAADWLKGMQSRCGGFAAFDADNDRSYLNEIPFADHGALLDPPTSDVSARVLTFLARLDRPGD
ncbi:MAG TPA: squalene--hopene cyclase, partial [Caldimonas sp.]|nr:squalene--hopene cyclase [Caldimonas sp.]